MGERVLQATSEAPTGMPTLDGACMCGAVAFKAVPMKMEMDACHCGMCRKWSGGVTLAVECHTITVADDTHLGTFTSSDWAQRMFCTLCGSSLFWRMQDGSYLNASPQLFDDPDQFHFSTEIFVDEKPSSYAFANDTKKMTAAEVIALFTADKG